MKSFYARKDIIKKVKKQLTEWDKIFANHVSVKYMYILTVQYPEYIKNVYNKKTKTHLKNRQ